MTAEEAICAQLLATAGVTALVSTRVYQLRLPQGPTLPAVRVQAIGAVDFYHLRGGDVTERARVQTDAYAAESSGVDPYAQAVAVAEAIHAALNGQRFLVNDSPASLQVTGVFRAGRQAFYEPEELRTVRIMQDWIVWSRRLL